jgi:hypothetical protein
MIPVRNSILNLIKDIVLYRSTFCLPTDENLFFKREISDEDFSALVPCLAKRD